MLGKEGEGFKIAMATLDGGRIGIAAQALGIAQGAFEHALAYAKERVQFGKPIGAQQIISFKLADMATKLRCARYLIYSAAELKEQHQPYGCLLYTSYEKNEKVRTFDPCHAAVPWHDVLQRIGERGRRCDRRR